MHHIIQLHIVYKEFYVFCSKKGVRLFFFVVSVTQYLKTNVFFFMASPYGMGVRCENRKAHFILRGDMRS